jgi:2-polyprenyl-6-methoxyphenol hydroxylase-like FAD-dependent oxidoreductase
LEADSVQKILIVGAGISGMCTALAVSKKYAERNVQITVIERDLPPPDGDADEAFFQWNRRGAAQFRHPHAFLGLVCNILQDNYPDLVASFWEAGARKVEFKDMLSPELMENYLAEPGDTKLWLLMCRRATIETVLRRYVEAQSNIEVRNAGIVNGIVVDSSDDIPIVKGISLRPKERDQGDEIIESDVLIDASGHTSQFSKWLKVHGVEIEEEREAAEIVYYTRHYKLLPGVEEPPRIGKERSAGDLGYIKFGVFPGDNGHFAVIICLPMDEKLLRKAVKSGETFDAIVNAIPGVARWVSDEVSESTTYPFGFSDIHAVWRGFASNNEAQVLNFFAVGDAAVRTNPLYGRGCSTGALHAHLLADVLGDLSDPIDRALEYDRQTRDKIRPIFEASLNEDRRGIKRANALAAGDAIEGADTLKKRIQLSIGDAIGAAARDQIHVLRGAMRTFNLLEKPGAFMSDWSIRFTIFRYLFRGRKENAKARFQPGPSRSEMIEIVEKNTRVGGD